MFFQVMKTTVQLLNEIRPLVQAYKFWISCNYYESMNHSEMIASDS